MRQILSTEYLPSAGPPLFHTIASCHEKARYVRTLRREIKREMGEEVEIEQIVANVHRNADISEIHSPLLLAIFS